MVVHHIEGGKQTLAALAVEAADGLAQALDGLDEVVPLAGDVVVLGLELGQLLVGAQVDGAEALPVVLEGMKLGFDLAMRRKLVASFRPASSMRPAGVVSRFSAMVRVISAGALRQPRGGPGSRRGLAGGRERLQGGAGGAVGLGRGPSRHRRGGRRLPCASPRPLDFGDEGAAALR